MDNKTSNNGNGKGGAKGAAESKADDKTTLQSAAAVAAEEQAKRDAEIQAQAANTTRLMNEAKERKRQEEIDAAEKVESDRQRAEEESARVQAEADARSRQEAEARAQREADEAADKIAVTVPRAFKLNVDNHRVIDYPAGTYGMPRAHADHWWSKANGVILFTEVVAGVNEATKGKQD